MEQILSLLCIMLGFTDLSMLVFIRSVKDFSDWLDW